VTGNVWVALPLVCLAGGAFFVYLVARFLTSRNDLLALFTAGVFAAALGCLLSAATPVLLQPMTGAKYLPAWGHFGTGGAFLRADPGALVVAGVALGLGLLVAVFSGRYLALDRRYETYHPLLLLLVAGLVGMLLAADLFNLYMFCELMSVAAYVLVAFRRHTRTAIEAGFKYLVMGSVGTVIILLGISFVYRETGRLRIAPTWAADGSTEPSSRAQAEGLAEVGPAAVDDIRVLAQTTSVPGPWTRAGTACFLVGLAIKSAIVPFHTWLPDAHGRAPSSISAMLSGVVVQSAFYTLLKVCLGLGFPAHSLGTLLIMLSLLNMTLGNGLALVQTHTKRLLAYSTIAQMGYIMLSVGVGLRYDVPAAIQAGFFLLLAQAAMKGLAFLCKGVCHFYCGVTTVDQLRGTAAHMPLVAVAFSVALAGLAGVPPLAGFTGKWFILTGALRSSDALGYVGLVVFLLNSLLALGYYLPLIGTLFAPPPPHAAGAEGGRTRISPWMTVPIVALGALVIAIGLYPGPWLDWTADAGAYLLDAAP
jgi:formate hydrogenlyase subunit 3/multisubunit Na+/H+ antiporter MnhD subunit